MKLIKKLKRFYSDQSGQDCLKIYRTTEVNQIILIRHAKPMVSPKPFVTFDEAEKHLQEYRNSGVYKDFVSPICTENLAGVTIYHSDLNRARETALQLFPKETFTLIEDKRFRELERQNIKLPFKMPYKLHTILSRFIWLFGTMKHIETPKEAWKRMKGNAHYLDSKGQNEKLLLVVAHGIHNYIVGKFLKWLGYTLLHDGGKNYLSVNIWAK